MEDIPFPLSQETKFSIAAKRASKKPEKDNNFIVGTQGAQDRDKLYSALLAEYIDVYKTKQKEAHDQREKFIKYAYWIMGGVLLVSLAMLVCLIFVKMDRASMIVSASAAVVTILTTLISIPLTITKHLFPQEMDHEIVDIVKSMIVNDCEIRKIQSEHDCAQCEKKKA